MSVYCGLGKLFCMSTNLLKSMSFREASRPSPPPPPRPLGLLGPLCNFAHTSKWFSYAHACDLILSTTNMINMSINITMFHVQMIYLACRGGGQKFAIIMPLAFSCPAFSDIQKRDREARDRDRGCGD